MRIFCWAIAVDMKREEISCGDHERWIVEVQIERDSATFVSFWNIKGWSDSSQTILQIILI